jgi:ABC-type dipeptide/oligopeptide/nickel transport system permease subunit
MATQDEILKAFEPEYSPVRRWRKIRAAIVDVVTNLPLILGFLMVMALILVALYAPVLAPHNPFEMRALVRIDGELTAAPFEPSEHYPLGSDVRGRDILSMLLYGARQTLVIAIVVVAARLSLGCIVGALAGWFPGSAFDRLAMAAADFSAAFPPLILGAILIFLFDIRQGMVTFALALCFIGWGEIAQYVRSEFIVVRGQPYIEGARAIGLTEVAVIFRHAVPNVITSLIVLAALEMSAVLLLLGELGFVGIFVGGGSMADVGDRPAGFFDVPEWGGMLAGSWRYIRNKFWIPLYPAAAFAFSILAFNLFGEGLRRLVEKGRIPVSVVYSRRTLAIIALVALVTMTVMNNTGPQAQLARLAAHFDEEAAFAHIEYLASEELKGRPPGTPEGRRAAEYIAEQFESLGLLPAVDDVSYFQTFPISFTYLMDTPTLEIVDGEGNIIQSFAHRQDFRELASNGLGAGSAESAEVVVVVGGISFKPGDREAGILPGRDDFRGVDVRGKIVLLVPDRTMPLYRSVSEILERGGRGVLVPGREESVLLKGSYSGEFPDEPKLPGLLISPELTDIFLAPKGKSEEQIREHIDEMIAQGDVPHIPAFDTTLRVRMSVPLAPYETRMTQNVIAYLPGSDPNYSWQTVFVTAHYDHLTPDANGDLFLGANDNASGVAVMLEIARLIQEVGYEPKQTVVFAAWGAEEMGLVGSEYYVDHPHFAPSNVAAVLNLDMVGAGDKGKLSLSKDERAFSLFFLVENAAHRMGVGTIPERFGGSDHLPFLERNTPAILLIFWEGVEEYHTPGDTIEMIELPILDQAGMAASMALMDLTDGN